MWHKFGIPQAAARIKDRRANRDGLKPEKERKPKLLRLADPANLKPEAPEMIQAAAKIKEQEDLAPQKVKALLYLGKVGCGCYNKKNADIVEAALLAGLEDCTPEVRKAAIQAVTMSACTCECSNAGCNGSACCTEKVVKKLEELAYKQDKQGCYLEAVPEIRSAAENALNACPPLPFKPAPELLPEPKKPEKKVDIIEARSNRSNQGSFQTVGVRLKDNNQQAQIDQSRLIDATVEVVNPLAQQMLIRFPQPYAIPEGTELVVARNETDVLYCKVIATEAGSVIAMSTDQQQLEMITPQQFVLVGIRQATK
jgi:hypothetical protein